MLDSAARGVKDRLMAGALREPLSLDAQSSHADE